MGNTESMCKCECNKENENNSELNTDNRLGDDLSDFQTTSMHGKKQGQEENLTLSKCNAPEQEYQDKDKIGTSKSSAINLKVNHIEKESEEEPPLELDHTPMRPSKKNLYLNLQSIQPLEVINELNTESFNDSLKISEEKRKKTEKTQNVDLKLELIGEQDDDTPHKSSEKEVIQTQNSFNKQIERQAKLLEEEQNEHKRMYDSKQKLEQVDISCEWNWKNTLITNIIPESKLLSTSDDDIMFQGVLDKIIENPSNTRKLTYSNKFCVISKKEFKCFKSKETFLHLQNPLQSIDLERILFAKKIVIPSSERANNTNNVRLFHFYVQLADLNYDESLREQYTWSSEDESNPESKRNRLKMKNFLSQLDQEEIQKKEEFFINLLQSNGRYGERQSIKSKRMSLLDDTLSLEIYNNNKGRRSMDSMNILFSKNILIFSSEKERSVNQWVTVINYFAKKN